MRTMSLSTVILVASLTFLAGSLYYAIPIFARTLEDLPHSELVCGPLESPVQALNSFDWTPEGNGGRFVLRMERLEHEHYLWIRHLSPALEGLSLPAIISSHDAKKHQTLWVPTAVLQMALRESFSKLPERLRAVPEYEVMWPVPAPDTEISQAAGRPRIGRTHDPALGMQNAVDIVTEFGAPVVAARDGTVVWTANRHPDIGCYNKAARANRPANQVVILHDDGSEAVYAHLRQGSIQADIGQRVEAGQPIGEVGRSGGIPTPHLHFHVGGITPTGYQTLPVVFRCADGRRIAPRVRGPVC